MLRLFGAIVFTVIAVAFSMANMERVRLNFVVFPPTQVRLFFLLLISFIAGVLVSTFVSMMMRLRLKTRLRTALQRAAHLKDLGRQHPTSQGE
jgi:uncharacterized membrane protein YciS (DUF1049 family)